MTHRWQRQGPNCRIVQNSEKCERLQCTSAVDSQLNRNKHLKIVRASRLLIYFFFAFGLTACLGKPVSNNSAIDTDGAAAGITNGQNNSQSAPSPADTEPGDAVANRNSDPTNSDPIDVQNPFEVVTQEPQQPPTELVEQALEPEESGGTFVKVTGTVYAFESLVSFRVANYHIDASAPSIRTDDGDLRDLNNGACLEVRGTVTTQNQTRLLTASRVKFDEDSCR